MLSFIEYSIGMNLHVLQHTTLHVSHHLLGTHYNYPTHLYKFLSMTNP